MPKIITDQDGFEIQPKDIDATGHFWSAFENRETEVSAGYIVRMCQERGGWVPFTMEEIEVFYRRSGHTDGFTFNRLVEPGVAFEITRGRYLTGGGWVILGDDGKYHVTEDFIRRCYKSSPARTGKARMG